MGVLKKFYSIFLIFLLLTIAPNLFADSSILDTKISLEVSNKKIGDVLNLLEQRVHVRFVYVSGIVDLKKNVSLAIQNTSLKEVLRQLLPDKNIQISASGNNIVFSRTNNYKSVKKTIQMVHDTIQLVVKDTVTIKDTVHVSKTDTVIVIKFDTIYKPVIIDKKADSKYKFAIGGFIGYEFIDEKISLGRATPAVLDSVMRNESISSSFCGGIDLRFIYKRVRSTIGLGVLNKTWNINKITPNLGSGNGSGKGPGGITNINLSTISSSATAGYLNIPVNINYAIVDKPKFTLYLGGGTAMNILLYSNGNIYISPLIRYDLLSNYLNKTYFRANANLGATYNFANGNSLGLDASYSLNYTPQFGPNYLLRRDEQLFTLSLKYYWHL